MPALNDDDKARLCLSPSRSGGFRRRLLPPALARYGQQQVALPPITGAADRFFLSPRIRTLKRICHRSCDSP